MKKILGIVVLGLLFSGNAYADDIKDFQIEGMSLGDSSLDHFSENEIKKFTQKFRYNNNDFVPVSPKMKLETFDTLQFYYKNNDVKKPIHVISGIINFKNNKDKIKYIHVLTPKGVALRIKLTFNFMKRKMKEYDELKAEVEKKK